MRAPVGVTQRFKASVGDGSWSFSHAFGEIGTYRAWVQAVDIAGNRRTNGSFIINVTTAPPQPGYLYTVYMPLVLR